MSMWQETAIFLITVVIPSVGRLGPCWWIDRQRNGIRKINLILTCNLYHLS